MSLALGTRLGPYEIAESIGAGGMGEVYRARDTRLGRDVAIKVLPASVASDGDRRARFEREMQAAAALSHPNVLAIFDTGLHDGQFFAVAEQLQGQTLRDRLTTALPTRKAIEIAIQVARGLAAAHAKGLVHRDLKPSLTGSALSRCCSTGRLWSERQDGNGGGKATRRPRLRAGRSQRGKA